MTISKPTDPHTILSAEPMPGSYVSPDSRDVVARFCAGIFGWTILLAFANSVFPLHCRYDQACDFRI
jgi:hypothetical protein